VTGRLLPAAFGLPAILCAAWTVFAGKDVNWDLLHYHYYLPFELLGGRIEQDFFAASAQSYLNPVGSLPFYLMVSSGWHSILVSILVAVAHSLSIGFVFLIAWKMFGQMPPRSRIVFSTLATALGAATSVYWATVGTSFLDPLLAPLTLAAVLLLCEGKREALRAGVAGALFGAAAALKYSNVIFLVAGLPLAFFSSHAGRMRTAIAYVAGAALAIAVLAGPWLALMLAEFGNPVFPLMNAWFQSPHGLPINLVSERFMPKDLGAAAVFPLRVAVLDRSLYSETFAPDLRFAAVAAAAFALGALAFARRSSGGAQLRLPDWRLFAFFTLGYVLWLATSANGRYGMVLLLLLGICLARLTWRLLPERAARTVLVLLLLVQVTVTILASPPRWFVAEPWSKRWLPFDVPQRARDEPALYLTLEVLSMSAVAPFLHPGSSFVNLRGQYSLPPESPKLKTLLEKHRGRVRALGRGLKPVDGRPAAEQLQAYDATLMRIGYRVDADDCYTIPWRPDDADILSRAANWFTGALPWHEPFSVATCALVPAPRDPADARRERETSAMFDRIEKACPKIFRGQTAVTEPLGGGWSRYYVGLDARLESHGERMVLNRYRAAAYVDLGLVSEWQRGARPPACVGQ